MKNSFKVAYLLGAMLSGGACFRANVKYGAIITEIKGKVGGHTFKATTQGGVMQTKTNRSASGRSQGKLTKADAGRVINPLKNTGLNASSWRSLTTLQRADWISAAPNFPFLNKFGEYYTPSGFQLFMSVNNNLLNAGAAAIDNPPMLETIENCPAFTISGGTGVGDPLILNVVVPAGYKFILYGTTAQSAGRGYEAGRIKALVILPAGDATGTDITAAYNRIFGSTQLGQSIWFSGKLTKADAGRQGQPYVLQYEVS